MKVWLKKALVAYLAAVVGTFVLAAIVQHLLGLEAGMKVQNAATCILILPFQFVAWIFSWFSRTPGSIDQYAINNLVSWALIIGLVIFLVKVGLKKFKQAWAGVVGGGGGGHH